MTDKSTAMERNQDFGSGFAWSDPQKSSPESFEANYEPTFPQAYEAKDLPEFIKSFYSISDTPGKDNEWASFFTDGALVAIGTQEARGKQELLQMRRGMWEGVEARKHRVHSVFSAQFPSQQEDAFSFALFGSVWFKKKSGEEDIVDWAGSGTLTRDKDGALKFEGYRVYLQQK